MPTLAPAPLVESISAERTARRNWRVNCDALSQTQPWVAEQLRGMDWDQEWVFARDGSLTTMRPDGKWFADCSVPLLASRALLKSLEEGAIGSCLLAPGHAGMVRAARERMGPWAVLFVVQADLAIAQMILACDDFSEQVLSHRLWFTIGPQWPKQFRDLLSTHSGLATPTRFIRTKLTSDEIITPMIGEAQTVFSDVLSQRGEEIATIQSLSRKSVDQQTILHVGGSEFRLWDFGAAVLEQELAGQNIHRFDTDHALSGSPLALLNAARDCSCVVAANLCRADTNQLLDTDLPWITWLTVPAAPPFETAERRDGLVLADAAWRGIARKAGWPEDRVRVCGWPQQLQRVDSSGSGLGIICDTQVIQIPAAVKDFSSHRLLWDLIEGELAADPLAVEEVDAYLSDRAGQLNINAESLDRRAFTENLILPAYQQGLARLLIAAGLPVSIWGKGWTDLAEFSKFTIGEIRDCNGFENAIGACGALIYCWPNRAAHAIDFTGKSVVHRAGKDASQFIRNARRAVAGSERRGPIDRMELGKVILGLMDSK